MVQAKLKSNPESRKFGYRKSKNYITKTEVTVKLVPTKVSHSSKKKKKKMTYINNNNVHSIQTNITNKIHDSIVKNDN